MISDPFDIIGKWKLTSENSDELVDFMPDGTYRIYYEIPFRMIEIGEWYIKNESLFLKRSKVETSSTIISLKRKELLLRYIYEDNGFMYNSFVKVG